MRLLGPDPERVDRLFRASRLYRDKWDRDDYRNRTLNKALRAVTDYWRSAEEEFAKFLAPSSGLDAAMTAMAGKPTDGAAHSQPIITGLKPQFISADELIAQYPHRRNPVIEHLLREGEIAGIIAPPKRGKSWLAHDLGLAVATGRPVLGAFDVRQCDVLIIDNELHREEISRRIDRVATERFIEGAEYPQRLFIEPLRRRLVDIHAMAA